MGIARMSMTAFLSFLIFLKEREDKSGLAIAEPDTNITAAQR